MSFLTYVTKEDSERISLIISEISLQAQRSVRDIEEVLNLRATNQDSYLANTSYSNRILAVLKGLAELSSFEFIRGNSIVKELLESSSPTKIGSTRTINGIEHTLKRIAIGRNYGIDVTFEDKNGNYLCWEAID